jgi:glycosyltransferase involved in cell wall biosynthesis
MSATSVPGLLPTLSVVIIGRNEGERLARCIATAQAIAGWPASEILYVDSGSTDGSPRVAEQMGARLLALPPGGFTAARARNLGWREARGEMILFLDGDTLLHANFPLAALAEIEKSDRNAAAWGHRREIRPETSVYMRVLDLDWAYPPGETPFFGGDVLVRRAALESVNGFDPELIAGEEPELCRRLRSLGWRIQHVDVPMTLHDLGITRFSQYWRRSQRAGFAYASVAARFKQTSDPFWSVEARRNRLRGMFWLVSPVAALIGALLSGSVWPVVAWLLLLALAALRTAVQSRWKTGNWSTLLLYGVHSHLQQIPILFGQLQFLRNRNQTLMEYKDVSANSDKAETLKS